VHHPHLIFFKALLVAISKLYQKLRFPAPHTQGYIVGPPVTIQNRKLQLQIEPALKN
jgi:hypothetical protein